MGADQAPLFEFEARSPDDSAKDVLELTHDTCGQVLCDIEPGDSLATLGSVAAGHRCPQAGRRQP